MMYFSISNSIQYYLDISNIFHTTLFGYLAILEQYLLLMLKIHNKSIRNYSKSIKTSLNIRILFGKYEMRKKENIRKI